jgi:hypothetical protein
MQNWLSTLTAWDREANSRSHSPPFMDSESSLPSSQEPVTGPYPEPDESTPHPPTRFSLINVKIIPDLYLRLPSGLSPSAEIQNEMEKLN